MSQHTAGMARTRRLTGPPREILAIAIAIAACSLLALTTPPARAASPCDLCAFGPADAATHMLSGTVTSLPGASPLADVTVEVNDASTHVLVASAITGADGRYSTTVPTGTYTLHAIPPSGSPFREATTDAIDVEAATTIDIGLVRPGVNAVQGTVVDRDGTPVAGLRLELSSASHFALVWTDDQGRYAAALPDGAYSVYGRVSEYSGLYNLPDYTSFFGSLVVAGDVSRSEVLRSNVVAVLVVDSQGDPLPGATVKSTGFTEGSTVVLGGRVRRAARTRRWRALTASPVFVSTTSAATIRRSSCRRLSVAATRRGEWSCRRVCVAMSSWTCACRLHVPSGGRWLIVMVGRWRGCGWS